MYTLVFSCPVTASFKGASQYVYRRVERGAVGPALPARGKGAPVADWLRAALQSLRRSDFLSHKPGERLVKSAKRQTD